MEFILNIFDLTPLIFAASEGKTDVVDFLLEQPNIKINQKDI